MKLITAVVKPDKLDDVINALSDAGARGLTVIEVRGFGQQCGHMTSADAASRQALVLPKLRVEVLVNDQSAELVTEAIAKSVDTHAIGDGKIWICPVEGALRVRTGERDAAAI
jgi:nitrogen regulatory protein PII